MPDLLQPLPDGPDKRVGFAIVGLRNYTRNLYVKTKEKDTELIIPRANQFAAMLDEMALAARENRTPKTPGEEGLRDVKIMQAIYQAADSGKEVTL